MTLRIRFDALDFGLFGLGLAGLILFVGLLPRQHPDAAASYAFGRERAVEAAQAFLETQGYATDDLVAEARLIRLPDLLDSLQAGLGRPATLRVLGAGGGETLPAYHWTVRWHRQDRGAVWARPEPAGGPHTDRLVYEVDLTPQGVPWQLRNAQAIVPRAGVDRAVLRSIFDADDEMGTMLMAPPDSTLGALLYFDLSSAPQLADSAALLRADHARLHEAAMTGRPQGLGEAAAVLIARRHLAATAFADLPYAVQSVEALPERGRSARVRFAARERVHGQRVEVETDVSAAGALLRLQAFFNEASGDDPVGDANVQLGESSESGWHGVLKIFGYTALLFVLLVVLFRRLSGRSLDARAALKDALLAGGLAMVATGLAAPAFAVEAGNGWQLALLIGIGMLFGGAGLGLLVFVASGASDALARAVWPERIETLSLVRQGAWVNQPVGRVLLVGAAVAGVVLGVVTLAMVLFPHGVLHEDAAFAAEHSFSVVGMSFAQGVWYALLLVLAVYVGLGSMLQKRWPRAVVPGLALALVVVGFDAVNLMHGGPVVAWGVPLALGLGLAFCFVRYDALTLLVAVVLTSVLWDTAEGWLVADSPAFADALLGAGVFAGALALGFAGVRSERTGERLPSYVPDYVVEQRERGRLQRELEIAREVQRSFLPAQMPRIAGLDLAAQCLAAEEVGGDYYDVIPLGDRRLALVIGDVSGKGIQAAFFMTLAKGFLQTLARETDSPAEVLRRANRLFFANAPRGTFISLIYGVFDLDARTFTFARAGHNPVILKRSPNQTADFVQPAGLAIGLTPRSVFDETIQEDTITLRRGDTLVLYTDGFSEAMDPAKRLYTDERLAAAVAAAPSSAAASDLLQSLVADVVGHAGAASQHDDMTMLVVRVGALADPALERDAAPTSESTPAHA